MEECYRKLWATYRFRLARYRLDRGQVPYLTASTRMGNGIFFVFLNARKDSDRLRTQTAIDKLWLGAFSVDTNTGECFTYGSIYGDEERIYPETWKIPWIEFLRKIDPQTNHWMAFLKVEQPGWIKPSFCRCLKSTHILVLMLRKNFGLLWPYEVDPRYFLSRWELIKQL